MTADGSTPPTEVRASVTYGFREYVSVVSDHAFTEMCRQAVKRGKTPPESPSVLLRATLLAILPFVFWFKTRKVGTCAFAISESGLERKCKMGANSVAWSEVKEIHRYSQAYLVLTAKGGYPLPYRCFSGESAQALERLVLAHQVQLGRGA